MKKIISIVLIIFACTALFVGCGDKQEQKNYTNDELISAITNCKNEMVEYNPALSYDDETTDPIFELNGFTKDNYEAGAMSISLINIHAYAIAIAQPVQDKADDVFSEFESYVQKTQESFEQYLPDQYEIAKDAIVEKLDNGLVIMVMCDNSQETYDNIIEQLNK